MGFDLLIAGGNENRLFSKGLMDCLVEVRVEQSLDEPTKFAIRFLDDIENGQMVKASLPELAIGQLVTIAVRARDGLKGLVRGPILRTSSKMTLGGPGSSYQVEGIDRRDELSREFREGAWSGRASDIATILLSPVYPAPDVGRTEEMHDPERPLPQRGTDLDFLTRNAAQNGFHFWVSYQGVAEVPGGTMSVIEQVHWKESPALGASAPTRIIDLIPFDESALPIRWNVPQEQCPNVTGFTLSRDGTRPNQVRTETQNTGDGGQDAVTASDTSSPVGGQGQTASQSQTPRFIVPTPQGDAQSTRTINRAALREAGFYVKAEVNTTRYLYGDVLEPHQVIPVEGLGGSNGQTPFRVQEVTHVVNSQAHFMQAKLATNAEVAVP
jgi:hypothetical protein